MNVKESNMKKICILEKIFKNYIIFTDMEDTKKLLVDAANFSYPLSIILVGLTSKDKEKRRNMNLLDGDTKALSYRNQKAKRDIVQFVG